MKVPWIRLQWAGGTHVFRLVHEPAPAIARPLAARPGAMHDRVRAVLDRLVTAQWGAEDVAHTIECGLIGGGDFTPAKDDSPLAAIGAGRIEYPDVEALVAQHVLARPLGESVALAQAILLAAIVGVPAALAEQGIEAGALPLGDLAEAVD